MWRNAKNTSSKITGSDTTGQEQNGGEDHKRRKSKGEEIMETSDSRQAST